MGDGDAGIHGPEVERGEEATPAADVYSLGVVFFKLLTGLWYEPNLAPGAGGATDAVKLLADFGRPWRDVLPVMLNERPEDRPTELRELPEYLSVAGEAGSLPYVGAASCRASAVGAASCRARRMTVIVFSVLGILVCVAIAVWFFLRPSTSTPDFDSSTDDAYAIPEAAQ